MSRFLAIRKSRVSCVVRKPALKPAMIRRQKTKIILPDPVFFISIVQLIWNDEIKKKNGKEIDKERIKIILTIFLILPDQSRNIFKHFHN